MVSLKSREQERYLYLWISDHGLGWDAFEVFVGKKKSWCWLPPNIIPSFHKHFSRPSRQRPSTHHQLWITKSSPFFLLIVIPFGELFVQSWCDSWELISENKKRSGFSKFRNFMLLPSRFVSLLSPTSGKGFVIQTMLEKVRDDSDSSERWIQSHDWLTDWDFTSNPFSFEISIG